MLTSFFSKSKPIQFILVTIFIIVTFFWNIIGKSTSESVGVEWPFYFLLLAVLLFCMFLIDFVSAKNDLTKNNTYRIVFFALFIAVFPETFLNAETLFANMFLLLAIRRIISLRTKKDVEKKIFDAALWITIATLITFWSVLFYLLLFVAIFQYTNKLLRYFMIPFLGMACVMVLWNVYYVFKTEMFYLPHFHIEDLSLDFSYYAESDKIVSLLVIAGLFLMAFLYAHIFLKRRKKIRSRQLLLYTLLVISLMVIALIPQKNTAELLFFALPFCVIVSNFMELPKLKILKEVVFWILFVLPFLSFLF